MFNGEFSNAAYTGKFIAACLNLYKKLGDTSVIPKRIKEIFPEAFLFFSGKEGKRAVVRISEDMLRGIIIKVFELNTGKFMSMELGEVYELYSPMKRELGIEHRKNLKAILKNLPEGLDEHLVENLTTFRELL